MDRVPLSQKRSPNSKHPHFSPRFSPPTELHQEYYKKINFENSPHSNQYNFPIFHYQNTKPSDNELSYSIDNSPPNLPHMNMNNLHFLTKISDNPHIKLLNVRLFRKFLKNKLRKEINNYKTKLESLSNERDKISNCYVAIASLERMIKTENPSNGFREGIYEVLKTLSADPGDNINLTNQIISTMLEIIIKIWQDKGFGRCAICKLGVVMESSIDNVNNLWLCTNKNCVSNKLAVASLRSNT
ncbi:hypothetical protein C2G38_2084863 [Gigaspora rosea]|uniref:Uncharacterized protein n=1 Tax=Gigaspora rosea TaxID=44941 RepID=A0A397VFV5_9GLOM|nr:hypothetical protein C2G38_2084863 [Gigaspora rosea]